ncbi:uncharacterized protein LOC123536823 [Mercenaria mercenaria]|uniref:uncharacterized protein LOC123536823 n=1 Tax=Mercenaria mercenaria TaxID=6596 RepID=UPI00234E73C5|nr:uncharacterized protein LOC123536823 [Mercenaria mercenaria]
MSVQSISLQVPKVKKRKWGKKPKPGESLKMLAAGSLAFAKAYSSVEKLEHELEAEIQRDKENDPKKVKGIHKWRRKCGKLLLSKYILLFIVVLNIIDCALVLGELILDLHHVKDILFETQQSSASFLESLQTRYPSHFSGIPDSRIDMAYEKILLAHLSWSSSYTNSNATNLHTALVGGENGTAFMVKSTSSDQNIIFNTSSKATFTNSNGPYAQSNDITDTQEANSSMQQEDHEDSVLRLVGYIFHKTSLSISVILVLYILLKIICFGRHLLDRRLEVFDTFVIMTSFVVDMIFVKGLSMYTLKQFVYILAFMLPWRVIRVTNSLVVAVKDHEHFRLKMLFTQKKKIEHENKQIRIDRDNYKEQVEALKKLCLSEGIDDWKIFQSLARQRPGGKGAMGSFASLAFGAFGNKSTSFWSVLGTPKMRRGKSMDLVDNKVNSVDYQTNTKRHSKGKILSFLGSSAEFFSKKRKNGHHTSLDSDPGIASSFLKHNAAIHQNGHIGKRLVRGETIDTLSTDSMDGLNDKTAGETAEDYSKQGTVDSSVFGEETGSVSHIDATDIELASMQRTQSDVTPCRPFLCRGDRVKEETGSLDRPRSASIGASTHNRLTVDHHAVFYSVSSNESMYSKKEDV